MIQRNIFEDSLWPSSKLSVCQKLHYNVIMPQVFKKPRRLVKSLKTKELKEQLVKKILLK